MHRKFGGRDWERLEVPFGCVDLEISADMQDVELVTARESSEPPQCIPVHFIQWVSSAKRPVIAQLLPMKGGNFPDLQNHLVSDFIPRRNLSKQKEQGTWIGPKGMSTTYQLEYKLT